jgi:hypothetical protein
VDSCGAADAKSLIAPFHIRRLIGALLGPSALAVMQFADAMSFARRKPGLQAIIQDTLKQLN